MWKKFYKRICNIEVNFPLLPIAPQAAIKESK